MTCALCVCLQSGSGQPLSPMSQQSQELSPSQIQSGSSTQNQVLQQQPTATVQHTYLPSTWGTFRNYCKSIDRRMASCTVRNFGNGFIYYYKNYDAIYAGNAFVNFNDWGFRCCINRAVCALFTFIFENSTSTSVEAEPVCGGEAHPCDHQIPKHLHCISLKTRNSWMWTDQA